jgi:membrane-associated phospholipid phosphatase
VERAARAITEVFSPVPVVAAMQLLVGWLGAGRRPIGLLYGVLAVLITIVPPYVFVLVGVRRRRFTDRHLFDRRQRRLPLLFGLIASTAGLVVLGLAGAPRLLLASAATVALGLLVGAAVNHFWKMSGHSAAAAAVLVIFAEIGHGWPLLAAPVVVAVGWSRVRLGAHTRPQVIVGALVGAAVAALAMPALI